MKDQKPLGPGDLMTPQNCTNIIYGLASCYACCFFPFLRSNAGEEAYGGVRGLGAFILLAFMAGADPVMAWYFWFWLAALLMRRAQTVANKRQGRIPHSDYSGWPKVAFSLFRCKTETKARNVEPVICLLVGIPIFYVSEVAGKFFILGAVSMWVLEGALRWVDNRKLQKMRDARIEAERMSAMYRGHEF